jgi:hypothetical protein
MDQVIEEKYGGKKMEDMDLNELEELEDLEDERVLL